MIISPHSHQLHPEGFHKATFGRWWKGPRTVGPYIARVLRYNSGTPNSVVPLAIGGSSLNSEVTSLYQVEAVTSDFDTAKVGPFAIQDTAISGPRLLYYAL